jgi:hypothetical protein
MSTAMFRSRWVAVHGDERDGHGRKSRWRARGNTSMLVTVR